ncbi:MAG: hypothetical protein ABSD53_08965 [Terriglobales bacterium]
MALRLHNRRWYPLFFLIACAVVVVAWLRFAPGHRPELLVSAIGGVAGFTYFLYRQHLDEATLFKDLFADFNARYGALNDGLNTILFGPREGSLSADERELLFSYFNLCAEEYFFFKAGYVDCRVWESWYRGMEGFFKHPKIHELWDQDCKADSYYGFRPPQ